VTAQRDPGHSPGSAGRGAWLRSRPRSPVDGDLRTPLGGAITGGVTPGPRVKKPSTGGLRQNAWIADQSVPSGVLQFVGGTSIGGTAGRPSSRKPSRVRLVLGDHVSVIPEGPYEEARGPLEPWHTLTRRPVRGGRLAVMPPVSNSGSLAGSKKTWNAATSDAGLCHQHLRPGHIKRPWWRLQHRGRRGSPAVPVMDAAGREERKKEKKRTAGGCRCDHSRPGAGSHDLRARAGRVRQSISG